jgi:hypothetical protein
MLKLQSRAERRLERSPRMLRPQLDKRHYPLLGILIQSTLSAHLSIHHREQVRVSIEDLKAFLNSRLVFPNPQSSRTKLLHMKAPPFVTAVSGSPVVSPLVLFLCPATFGTLLTHPEACPPASPPSASPASGSRPRCHMVHKLQPRLGREEAPARD